MQNLQRLTRTDLLNVVGRSGVVLCELMNKIKPGTIGKINRLK